MLGNSFDVEAASPTLKFIYLRYLFYTISFSSTVMYANMPMQYAAVCKGCKIDNF